MGPRFPSQHLPAALFPLPLSTTQFTPHLWPTMLSIMLPLLPTMLSTMPLLHTMLCTMLPPWSTMLPTTLLPTMLLLTTLLCMPLSITPTMPPSTTAASLMLLSPSEVCTPAFETVCETIEVPTKKIIDVEQCYPVTRTVCSESVEVIDNEICVYSYSQKVVATTAKTVTVPFKRECNTQMVTVCQPTPGYGYHQYGHNYCKEVAQETCYNVPVVTEDIQDVEVAFPEPIE